MNKFNEEVSHWKEYNYVVVNDNLEICYNNILKIRNEMKKAPKYLFFRLNIPYR